MNEKKAVFYFSSENRLANIGFDPDYCSLGNEQPVQQYGGGEAGTVYLIYDGLDLAGFEKVWESIGGHGIAAFAYVYHSKPAQGVKDFLNGKTGCTAAVEGIHDTDIPEKAAHYLEILPLVNHKIAFGKDFFDGIWAKYFRLLDLEKRLDYFYNGGDAVFKVPNGLFEEEKKRGLYYIGDPLVAELPGVTRLTPAEALAEKFAPEDLLLVQCEQKTDEKDGTVKRSAFYGIKLVQKMRREGCKNPVLFVSCLEKEEVCKQSINNGIIKAVGHGFARLPICAQTIQTALDGIPPLDKMSLHDIKAHFTDIRGFVAERIHVLAGKPGFGSYQEQLDLLTDVCVFFEEKPENRTSGYDKLFPEKNGGKDALDFVRKECETMLLQAPGDDTGGDIQPKHQWKILWLDDEVPDDSDFIIQVKKRGIEIQLVRTYEEADEVWTNDRCRESKIQVVIADYRLKAADGTHQKMQGYQFLESVAKRENDVALFVYSELPRKYLMETRNLYSTTAIEVRSKRDYPIADRQSVKNLIDDMIELGDKSWDAFNNQPSGKEWPTLKPSYIRYLKRTDKKPIEQKIGKLAADNLQGFIGQYKEGNPPYHIADPFPFRSGNFPSVEKTQDTSIVEIITARRLVVGLYCYLIKERKIDQNAAQALIAQIVYKSIEANKDKILDDNFENNHQRLFYNKNALTLTDFPVGLTNEERRWLQFDSGLGYNVEDDLKKHWRYIQKVKNAFSEAFEEHAFLQNLLAEERLAGFFFTQNHEPMIRTAGEAMEILDYIYKEKIGAPTSQNGGEAAYKAALTGFVFLLRKILVALHPSDIPAGFKALRTHIWALPAKTDPREYWDMPSESDFPIFNKQRLSIDEEYSLLFAAWEFRCCRNQRYLSEYQKFIIQAKKHALETWKQNVPETENSKYIYCEVIKENRIRNQHYVELKDSNSLSDSLGTGRKSNYEQISIPQVDMPDEVSKKLAVQLKDADCLDLLNGDKVRYFPKGHEIEKIVEEIREDTLYSHYVVFSYVYNPDCYENDKAIQNLENNLSLSEGRAILGF